MDSAQPNSPALVVLGALSVLAFPYIVWDTIRRANAPRRPRLTSFLRGRR